MSGDRLKQSRELFGRNLAATRTRQDLSQAGLARADVERAAGAGRESRWMAAREAAEELDGLLGDAAIEAVLSDGIARGGRLRGGEGR